MNKPQKLNPFSTTGSGSESDFLNLELHHAPAGTHCDTDLRVGGPVQGASVFITPAWQGHIELVTHLCQYSQNVLLVIAPFGGGKTTFLQHLSGTLPSAMYQQVLQADPAMPVDSLLAQVAHGFQVQSQGIEGTIANIQAALEEAYHDNQAAWTLFVDDAHLLTNAQLQILLELVKFDVEPRKQLHLVLLGEPSLELRLFSPEFTDYVHGKLYTVELESWTLLDVKNYFAKDDFLSPLTPEQMQYIFERSRGLPGFVIREKNALLKQSQSKKNNSSNFSIKNRLFHPVVIGVVFGVVIGGTYLLTHTSAEDTGAKSANIAELAEDPWTQAVPLPPKETTTVAIKFDEEPPMREQPMAITQSDTVAQASDRPLGMPSSSIAPIAEPALQTAENEAVTVAEEIDSRPVQPVAAAPIATKPERMIHAEPKKGPPVLAKQAIARAPVLKDAREKMPLQPNAKDRPLKNRLAGNPHHYTLQLLGASKEDKVKQFIAQHALEGKTQYFHTKRAGQDWFVVLYGDYPSSQEAKAAINKMPPSLKQAQLKPWVREFQSIKDDIRQQG